MTIVEVVHMGLTGAKIEPKYHILYIYNGPGGFQVMELLAFLFYLDTSYGI